MGRLLEQATGRSVLPWRPAEIWAHTWRWCLFAVGVAGDAYLLLDRGVANGVITAGALGVLMIGAVLSASKPFDRFDLGASRSVDRAERDRADRFTEPVQLGLPAPGVDPRGRSAVEGITTGRPRSALLVRHA